MSSLNFCTADAVLGTPTPLEDSDVKKRKQVETEEPAAEVGEKKDKIHSTLDAVRKLPTNVDCGTYAITMFVELLVPCFTRRPHMKITSQVHHYEVCAKFIIIIGVYRFAV
ncbi:hypothetical protein MKW98_013030 [Papaver atlanticum]|uniref:Uncharacterized protein n=1 Tax=Papaver atlanticum TaxID=357466 RepID=A0AAD4SJN7_9MAGN|nr:hypothetical protein MKW98_013030 [Papaver atlanticum]